MAYSKTDFQTGGLLDRGGGVNRGGLNRAFTVLSLDLGTGMT